MSNLARRNFPGERKIQDSDQRHHTSSSRPTHDGSVAGDASDVLGDASGDAETDGWPPRQQRHRTGEYGTSAASSQRRPQDDDLGNGNDYDQDLRTTLQHDQYIRQAMITDMELDILTPSLPEGNPLSTQGRMDNHIPTDFIITETDVIPGQHVRERSHHATRQMGQNMTPEYHARVPYPTEIIYTGGRETPLGPYTHVQGVRPGSMQRIPPSQYTRQDIKHMAIDDVDRGDLGSDNLRNLPVNDRLHAYEIDNGNPSRESAYENACKKSVNRVKTWQEDARDLYDDCRRARGGARRRDISFGEGVPGQGYTNDPDVRARVIVHAPPPTNEHSTGPMTRSRTGARAGAKTGPGTVSWGDLAKSMLQCRHRDCGNRSSPHHGGFCRAHGEQIQQDLARSTSKLHAKAATPRPVSTSMKGTYQRRHPDSASSEKVGRHTIPQMKPKSPTNGKVTSDSSSMSLPVPRTESEAIDLNDPDLQRDYEEMVNNIISVSKIATRKCVNSDCHNFGNESSDWFCNGCYAKLTGSVKQNQEMKQGVKQNKEVNQGVKIGPMNPQGQDIRKLISQTRYRCKTAGCHNFASREGLCNSCWSKLL